MTRYVSQIESTDMIKTIKIGRNSLLYIPAFIELLS